jgi:hypothetical protein
MSRNLVLLSWIVSSVIFFCCVAPTITNGSFCVFAYKLCELCCIVDVC